MNCIGCAVTAYSEFVKVDIEPRDVEVHRRERVIQDVYEIVWELNNGGQKFSVIKKLVVSIRMSSP